MKKYILFFWILVLIASPVFHAFADGAHKKDIRHTVLWGQTLIGVAYCHGVDPVTLAKYNGLKDWDRIYAGQKLRIPRSRHARSKTIEVYVYTVKFGDTLLSIAAKFRRDPYYIAAINHIMDLNLIHRGRKLYVPK